MSPVSPSSCIQMVNYIEVMNISILPLPLIWVNVLGLWWSKDFFRPLPWMVNKESKRICNNLVFQSQYVLKYLCITDTLNVSPAANCFNNSRWQFCTWILSLLQAARSAYKRQVVRHYDWERNERIFFKPEHLSFTRLYLIFPVQCDTCNWMVTISVKYFFFLSFSNSLVSTTAQKHLCRGAKQGNLLLLLCPPNGKSKSLDLLHVFE